MAAWLVRHGDALEKRTLRGVAVRIPTVPGMTSREASKVDCSLTRTVALSRTRTSNAMMRNGKRIVTGVLGTNGQDGTTIKDGMIHIVKGSGIVHPQRLPLGTKQVMRQLNRQMPSSQTSSLRGCCYRDQGLTCTRKAQ